MGRVRGYGARKARLRFRPCRLLQVTNLRILDLTLNEMGSHWRTLRMVNYPDLWFLKSPSGCWLGDVLQVGQHDHLLQSVAGNSLGDGGQ